MKLPAAGCRAAAALAVVAGVVVLTPSMASAHTQTGIEPTNYRSEVLSLTPPAPGLRVRLLDLGRRVELTNRSATDVVVLGYQGEPYLRVGPTGVFENGRSPTVEQNKVSSEVLTTPSSLPSTAGPNPPPSWRRVSGSQTVRWRDHRTRWEGPTPERVRAAPGLRQVVSSWTIELRQAGAPLVVAGSITWVPPPSATGWLLMALCLSGVVLVAAFSRRWGLFLSAALAGLVALDIVLSIAAARLDGPPVSTQLVTVLLGGALSVVAWLAGAFAVGRLQEHHEDGLLVGGFVGLILLFIGLGGATSIGRSQVPFALSAGLARAGIAATLGLGLGMALAGPMVWRRHLRRGRTGPSGP